MTCFYTGLFYNPVRDEQITHIHAAYSSTCLKFVTINACSTHLGHSAVTLNQISAFRSAAIFLHATVSPLHKNSRTVLLHKYAVL